MYYVMITIKNYGEDVECEWKKGFDTYEEAVEKADFLFENMMGIWSTSVYHFNDGLASVDYVIDHMKER